MLKFFTSVQIVNSEKITTSILFDFDFDYFFIFFLDYYVDIQICLYSRPPSFFFFFNFISDEWPPITLFTNIVDDIVCCDGVMGKFFSGPAYGDKWVPWNTACGEHERYIASTIYSIAHLSDEEKHLLHFAFRASSFPPFFDHVVMPLFLQESNDQVGVEESTHEYEHSSSTNEYSKEVEKERVDMRALGLEMLRNPHGVLTRGSFMHLRFIEYRGKEKDTRKLHTTCYRNHPPKVYSHTHIYAHFICFR